MIQEKTMFTVICDNCGADVCEGCEYSCWNEKWVADDQAMEANWYRDGDKHYCSDCWSYDDNDNLILKTINPQEQTD